VNHVSIHAEAVRRPVRRFRRATGSRRRIARNGPGLIEYSGGSAGGRLSGAHVGTWAEALEIYAFAPGLDPASVEVSVEKGLLTLSGSRAAQAGTGKDATIYAKERFDGRFRRVVSLPDDSDPARVEASYRNGVLKVVVPRLESAKPRQIAINS
jgi:HSP20 family protein